ncbi:MAG: hypothetical protein L6R41_005324, partial [Letrouitia leprolyta]
GGAQYDRSSQSTYFVGGRAAGFGLGQSTASLLDGDGLADRVGREERVRKRMAEREREREIANQLGERGKGMGGEYLKIRHQDSPTSEGMEQQSEVTGREVVDAASLGLKGNRAGDVQLSPLKKRRAGGAVEGGARKKTRFLTEKGVREAGRESLGVVGREGGKGDEDEDDDEDDDELDIV